MVTQQILELLEKKGKKISRQYLFEFKNKYLVEGVDYQTLPRITIFNESGIDKILKKMIKK